MEYADLSKAIADKYPMLSPRLQVAARYVLDRPDDVALMTMRCVAGEAEVHPSTMVRLARVFEFDGYNAFRATFQRRLRGHPADYHGRARALQARTGGKAKIAVENILEAAHGNLAETFAANGIDRFSACAEALTGARRVFVAGRRSCFPIAHYFHYVYGVFRSNSVLLDGSGGTFADRLRGVGPDDVVFAVSFEPYSQETVQAADYVESLGGKVVALTDSLVSPLVDEPARTLVVKNESPSFFQSVAPAMAVVEALIALMVLLDGAAALSAINESERQLQVFDAYWNKPSNRHRRAGETEYNL